VKLLLDTHVLLWWLADSAQLSAKGRSAITRASACYVSAASAWEIAIKKALGKLAAPDDLPKALETNRFEPLSISVAHALIAGDLPRHHEDPFDRLLLAQAQVEDLTLLTHDTRLKRYGVPLLIA
jgi:PIN domain nuclease of toxin-antitoxin system